MVNGLYDPEHISKKTLKGFVSAERLINLCQSGYMPHYILNSSILLKPSEVKEWLEKNALKRHDGYKLYNNVLLVDTPPKPVSKIPIALQALNIYELPPVSYRPGIYFLCNDDEVVYVGQAISPSSRVSQHISAGKVFNKVFLLPCPQNEMDELETQFILKLRPKLNGRFKNGKMVVPLKGRQP